MVLCLSAHYEESVAAQVLCPYEFKSGVCIFGPEMVTFALTRSDQAPFGEQLCPSSSFMEC